jgi:hypothetical protein
MKHRDIKLIYTELVNHPNSLWIKGIIDVDDVVDFIIGDIKIKKFRDLIKKRIKQNKEEIYNIIYDTIFMYGWEHGINFFHDELSDNGLFDDIILLFFSDLDDFQENKYK